jgi:hypothetical protein
VDFSAASTNVSPSHFNSGTTSTAQPPPPEPSTPGGEPCFAISPSSTPQDKSSSARRKVVLAVIAVLIVLLIGTTFESGLLGPVGGGAPAVNSPSSAVSGQQLYAAYAANDASASAAYTNKTVYIHDTLDFGVALDFRTGDWYSSVDSGAVILIWNDPSQLGQLSAGVTILAKCSVAGAAVSPGTQAMFLYLQDCDLLNTQSQSASTTTSLSIPAVNE